jgi:hypothetical protein
MKRWLALAAIILLLIVPSAAAQGSGRIARHVIGSGGTSSGRLWGTIGQSVSGWTGRLCSGFWCGQTSETGTIIGLVSISARYTFGQIGIAAMLLISLMLVGAHSIYDVVRQIWVRRRSRSRPARSS